MTDNGQTWKQAAILAVRRMSAVTLAGALLGLLVGGVGGRLAMSLLANLNPEVSGTLSDDGFEMGRVTMSGTLNLFSVGTFLGIFGAVIYMLLRHLRIGPAWFRYLSVSTGAGVTVGSMLVHDGVDFTLLHPVGLAIALFVAIPSLYALLLQLLAERWLKPESAFMTTSNKAVFIPALVWIPLAPLFLAAGLIWAMAEFWRREDSPGMTRLRPVLPWLGRLVLAGIFTAASIDLIDDIAKFA